MSRKGLPFDTDESSEEEVVAVDTEEERSGVRQHFDSLTTALQNEFKKLESKKKEVEEHESALEKEKNQMQSVVADDDIIYLNIGGETMHCSRSTLCQVKGSLLASMFSGRWEDRLKKDKHGNVFLDFNPSCFKVILNYLRAKRIESPPRMAKKPTPPPNEDDNFWNLAHYLGLVEEMQSYSVINASGLLMSGRKGRRP